MIGYLALILIVLAAPMVGCVPQRSRQPATTPATSPPPQPQALETPAEPPHVVFIAAEDEYKSEKSLALLAEDARAKGWTTTLLTGYPDQSAAESIPGLEALERAELAVIYMRFRKLPAEQVAHLEKYLHRGAPVVGIRTSTHAFAYAKGDPLVAWNHFGRDVLGAPWIRHFGHDSTTDVTVAPGAETSALLGGVEPAFHVRSWLYDLEGKYPPAGSQILLVGQSCDEQGRQVKDRPPSAVAWTRTNAWGGKVFTTTLGHPEDFANASVRKLLVNAMEWAVDPKAK
ncbi:MAG: hypothetical protein GIKADHBN_00052 [Phycisphaerales bacterium]|nr:hypothetical protein [Phycisphaerales bacterium]